MGFLLKILWNSALNNELKAWLHYKSIYIDIDRIINAISNWIFKKYVREQVIKPLLDNPL